MNMFTILLKAALPAAAVFAVTAALVMAAGGGMLFWTPAGWMVAGLPALVVGGIVIEGSRESER
jgi:hypothetical protein